MVGDNCWASSLVGRGRGEGFERGERRAANLCSKVRTHRDPMNIWSSAADCVWAPSAHTMSHLEGTLCQTLDNHEELPQFFWVSPDGSVISPATSQCSLPLLSHWPRERYHTGHYAKRKSDFPLTPLHKRLDLWLEAVYHLPPEIGKKTHLHLIILQWHSWVLSAQELSFTGSIILLCDRGLGLETQVYNILPDLQTEVWSCNYQSLY